ncbi:MAG: putative glycoside hydrolase [Polyangia bacterium]
MRILMLVSASLLALSCGGSSPAHNTATLDGPVELPVPSADSGRDNGTAAPGGDGGAQTDAATATPVASRFPDTTATIAILADQLPDMTAQQQQFAATHYVGSQKLVLGTTRALRALNPNFVVLHYHLAMWQSAPSVTFITDGLHWSNDYPEVTTHESWFWHNASGGRVASTSDGKLLMNVSDPGFASYWADSIAQQTAAGEYDGVFLDSASPALLQGECSANDSRLAGTAARDQVFGELGGQTWIAAWDTWIAGLNGSLAASGIPLIPNTGAFTTTWDNSDYALTAGIFSEGFADPSFSITDWKASTNQLMAIAGAGKIVIEQNYLTSTSDMQRRLYYLANYLLVKGARTYLFTFADSTLEWYPEWEIDLGAPVAAPSNVDALAWQGVYRRDFAKGSVLVNPGTSAVALTLAAPMQQIDPQGGGAVSADGTATGTVASTPVTSLSLAPGSGVILLK